MCCDRRGVSFLSRFGPVFRNRFCFFSGRSGRSPHLRPMRLQTRRNGRTLTRPPHSAALFGYRGVDFCNVRVSFRPRSVFSLVLLTLGHRGLLAALVWGPLGYLLLWRRWPYGGLLGPALLPPDLHLLRGITFRGLPFMKYLIPPLERLGGPALRLRGQGVEDALKNGVGAAGLKCRGRGPAFSAPPGSAG